MQVQMIIKHVVTREKWAGDIMRLTPHELIDQKDQIKSLIGTLSYLEVGNTVLPGDFVRQNCIIMFEVDEGEGE